LGCDGRVTEKGGQLWLFIAPALHGMLN